MKKRGLAVLIALLLLVLWILLEQKWIQITPYTVRNADLPEAFHGLRVTELADLHGVTFGENQEKLLEKVLDMELLPEITDLYDE